MPPVADTMPGSKRPASASIAGRVTEQLHRDYPPNALSWVTSLSWAGPASVPAGQVDRTTGDTEWSAAAADKAKLQRMRTRISAGWKKPVILIRRPGQRLLFSMDGHSRILACAALGVPVTAYIGTAKTAHGEWERTHARQLASDAAALELSAQTPALAVTPSPWGSPSGPGLWRHKGWKLPDYVEQVSKGIRKSGRAASEAEAIQMALGVLRRWASGAGKVTPEVRAASAKAIADYAALKARAHAHANDMPAIELAGTFTEALHPRVAKGHGNAGQFGSNGTALKAPAGTGGGFRAAVATPASTMKPGPIKARGPAPEPPAEAARIRQLRHQAQQDRHLARQILVKVQGLVRVRDGYVAGLLTATGTVKGAKATKAVSAARSAAAKKAAATRKKRAKSSTKGAKAGKTAASVKAGNVAKLNGQINTLRGDAKALLKSASHLDRIAAGL